MTTLPGDANTPEEEALFAFDPHAAPANDLERTVRRLQRATGQDPALSSSIPTDLKRQIWEDLMHAQPATASPVAPLESGRAADLVSARLHTGTWPHSHVARWQTAINVTLIVALVLAAMTVLWRVTGNPFAGPGGEAPPEPLRFAAFQDGGQPELFEVAEVPDESECTVEPLTVDEVMARFQRQQGYEARQATPGASTPTAFEREQEELEGGVPYDIPDQATVDAIAASQRQWLACHLAGDLFRAWALEGSEMIQGTVFGIYGPQFAPETLRADLERLAAGEDDTPFQTMTASPDAYVPLLVTSGWDTLYPEPHTGKVEIPVYWTSLDGSVAAIPSYLSESQYNDPAYEPLRNSPNLPNLATYVIDYETKQWVLTVFESGGRG